MTFYVAGHLAASGHYDQLYPSPTLVHSLIVLSIKRHTVSCHSYREDRGRLYVYPPCRRLFCTVSLARSQVANVGLAERSRLLALLACSGSFSWQQITRVKSIRYLFFVVLVRAGIFNTVGRSTGLGFRLVAVVSRLVLVLRVKNAVVRWTGLVVAFAQTSIFFSAAFVAIVCACTQRFRPLIGMTLGVVALLFLTVGLFSWPTTLQWLSSHRVSDVYFFSGLQGIPSHLVTGLPANLMILLPVSARQTVKLPLYTAAAAAMAVGVWSLPRAKKSTSECAMPDFNRADGGRYPGVFDLTPFTVLRSLHSLAGGEFFLSRKIPL